MMGYLFLSISLLAGAAKGFCGKKTSGYLSEYKDAMFINFIRMLFCIIIGFVVMLAQGNIGLLKIDAKTLLITLCSGVTTSFFVVTWLISVKRGAYMMLDVFLMMGVVVPIISSALLYDEPVKYTQIIGLALLLIAVIIMCSYNNTIKEKISVSSFILLLLCGFASGLTDLSQKMFVKSSENDTIAVFNFYTYVFSAISLLIVYLIFKSKSDKSDKNDISEKNILKNIFVYVSIMSLCLYVNSYFKTIAAIYLPSAQLYPLSQGSSLILSSIMSSIFFKEKITVKAMIGICVSFVALLIINLL